MEVRQREGYAAVETEDKQLLISEREDGTLSVYVADHASIEITGEKKHHITVTVEKDEFPTEVKIDD